MPAAIYLLVGLLIGAAFGFLWGLVQGRSRAPVPDERLANELRQQLAQREGDLSKLREQMTSALRAQAEAQARSQAAEELLADLKRLTRTRCARPGRPTTKPWRISGPLSGA